MYDESNQSQESKTRIAIIAIGISVLLLIVTLSVIGIFINNSKTANIVNEPDNTSEVISDDELSRVKTTINPVLQKIHKVQDNLDGVVRWNTVEEETHGDYSIKKFIIDIDKIQQTYRVILDGDEIFFDCPELSLSKYPDSFCIGNYRDYNDSISVVFGTSLPLEEKTENGEYFTISRNKTMNSMDERYLEIYSYNCPNNDETTARINKRIDEIIESLGASPTMFERKILSSDCHKE